MTERFPTFTIKISRLHKLIQKLKTDGMGRFGLKGVDTLCLYQLGLHGSMTFAEIAEHCDLDAALVSRTLRDLTRNNMVAKEGGKYKARYSLTPEGQALTRQVGAIIHRIQAQADQGIAPEDLVTFYRVLGQLTQNFEHMAQDATTFQDPQQQEESPNEY